MNFTELLTHLPLEEQSPSTLFEAAQSRQTALRSLLQLLSQANDVGIATDEVLSYSFSGLQMLAADAECLYEAASSQRENLKKRQIV